MRRVLFSGVAGIVLAYIIHFPLKLLEDAVIGWVNAQLAENFGITSPSAAAVTSLAWDFGAPIAAAAGLLWCYHFLLARRDVLHLDEWNKIDPMVVWHAACLWAELPPVWPIPYGTRAYAVFRRLKQDIGTGKLPLTKAAGKAAQSFVSRADLIKYAQESGDRPKFLFRSGAGSSTKNTSNRVSPENENASTKQSTAPKAAATDPRVALATLRTAGVVIRNQGLALPDDASWKHWEQSASNWSSDVVATINFIDASLAEWFNTLDLVPPPRISGAALNPQHAKLFREHDYRLVRLDELLRNGYTDGKRIREPSRFKRALSVYPVWPAVSAIGALLAIVLWGKSTLDSYQSVDACNPKIEWLPDQRPAIDPQLGEPATLRLLKITRLSYRPYRVTIEAFGDGLRNLNASWDGGEPSSKRQIPTGGIGLLLNDPVGLVAVAITTSKPGTEVKINTSIECIR